MSDTDSRRCRKGLHRNKDYRWPTHKSPQPRYNMGFLWRICLVAAMGGLLFGYDWGGDRRRQTIFHSDFGLEEDASLVGWAMSSALVGCMIGAVLSGLLVDVSGASDC